MNTFKISKAFACGLCLLIAFSCDTPSNIENPDVHYFMKMYGRDGNQSAVDMVALDDGSLLLLGNTEFAGIRKIYLVNVDPLGRLVWERTYGNTTDLAVDIERTFDGNFVILSTFLASTDNTDIKLTRINQEGDKIDSVMYGFAEHDYAKSVTPLSDLGFIVTGETLHDEADFNPAQPVSNIFHFRCNDDLVFDPTWEEFYGDRGLNEAGTKTFEGAGVYYVFGHSNAQHASKTDYTKQNLQYYEINAGGTVRNLTYYGNPGLDTRSAFVLKAPDELGGGYLVASTENNAGAMTFQVSKLRDPLLFNPIDDEQFTRSLTIESRTLHAVSSAPTKVSSRGYLLLSNEIRTLGTANIFLTKIDQSAIPQWSVTLGSEEEDDRAAAVMELADGRIIVLGTASLADNQSKMVLFKLNSAGRLQE